MPLFSTALTRIGAIVFRLAPDLWSRWITFLSFCLILYGVAMVFMPQIMNRALVSTLLYGNNEVLRNAFIASGEPQQTFLRTLSGLLGTVTIGWSIQMAWIAHLPFRQGERWAWNSLLVSVSAWAALEFIFKLTNGISGVGLFAHFGLWIAFAIPLLATYRDFHS